MDVYSVIILQLMFQHTSQTTHQYMRPHMIHHMSQYMMTELDNAYEAEYTTEYESPYANTDQITKQILTKAMRASQHRLLTQVILKKAADYIWSRLYFCLRSIYDDTDIYASISELAPPPLPVEI